MSAGPAAGQGKWNDLLVRSLSAGALMPLALYSVWQGGVWFEVFVAGLAVMAAHEWVRIVHGGNERSLAVHVLAGLGAVLVTTVEGLDAACLVVLVLWLISVLQWLAKAGQGSVWSLLGVFYVSLPVIALVLLREDDIWGLWAVYWCLGIVWAADICAYFSGRIIGGPKLAPRLSPKKTWAGLIGAMAGAGILSGAFAWSLNLNVPVLSVLAAGLTCVEQAGDIMESSMKRRYGLKDSGDFIPGHGGILDRVDGLLAVLFVAGFIGFVHRAGNAAEGLLLW